MLLGEEAQRSPPRKDDYAETLAGRAHLAMGIDTSLGSLRMAKEYLKDESTCRTAAMTASALGFRDHQFDVVVCIQNGLSAFRLEPAEALGVGSEIEEVDGSTLFCVVHVDGGGATQRSR